MFQVLNGRVPFHARHKSSTSLVKSMKLGSISALLRHNHSHGTAGSQFDIRAKKLKLSEESESVGVESTDIPQHRKKRHLLLDNVSLQTWL